MVELFARNAAGVNPVEAGELKAGLQGERDACLRGEGGARIRVL
jgi:hypothetical protein